jgi:starvation-inducible DNA-binding protein
MKNTNHLGLNKKDTKILTEKLNQLLSNYQVLYINTRGFHWNIKGEKFFELHAKFEELYTDIQLKIDEIAERVLTLGEVPVHSYSHYLKYAKIKETTNVSDGKTAVKHINDSICTLIVLQRELLNVSDKAGDEGTNALMSDYIREQEKLVWMYSAYLG